MLKVNLKVWNTILFCFFIFAASAQGIQFETGNWNQILEKAKQEKKLVYVDIYAEWCGPCKMMAKNIFPTKEAGDKYNELFVNYKIDAEKGEGIDLAKKYAVTAYPTNLYVDPTNEKVVYKAVGATDLGGFLQRADFTMAEFNDPMTLAVYQEQYKKGERSKTFLENYIEKATRSEEYVDDVLDIYLQKYGKNANDSLLDFLLKNTMTFDNKVVDFLVKNKTKINATHQGVNMDYLTEWQQQLPYHTFKKAVKNKDEKLVDLLYNNMVKYEFPSNILGKYAFQIMYFEQTKDDVKANAKNIEMMNYLTNLPQNKYDAQNKYELDQIKNVIKQQVKKAGISDSQEVEIVKNTLTEHPEYAYSANFLAAQKLNETSWNIYEDGKADSKSLENALKWADKAMALTPNLPQWSMFADTYAHLLYKVGKKDDAIKIQEQAVKSEKEKGTGNAKDLESSLDKMKSRTL